MAGIKTTLGELPRMFAAMKLIDEILLKMCKRVGSSDNLITLSIKQAVDNKVDNIVIIKTLREMALDNHNMVADTLGNEITGKILNFA